MRAKFSVRRKRRRDRTPRRKFFRRFLRKILSRALLLREKVAGTHTAFRSSNRKFPTRSRRTLPSAASAPCPPREIPEKPTSSDRRKARERHFRASENSAHPARPCRRLRQRFSRNARRLFPQRDSRTRSNNRSDSANCENRKAFRRRPRSSGIRPSSWNR